MSEEDRRGYETRLLKFFPADDGAAREPLAPSLPDWLLNGAWITVSPRRAEQLPAEARSFVNEFVPIHGEDVPPAAERLVAREHGDDKAWTQDESPTVREGDKPRRL